MAKPELGTKRVCVACGVRFYDLTKVQAVCPKCGTEQPIEQPRPRRTGGNVAEERRPKKPVPAPGLEAVARAYAKLIDQANAMDRSQLMPTAAQATSAAKQ